MPILWKNRQNGALLGYLDMKTETAYFSHDKIVEEITGTSLGDMLIIVREMKGGKIFNFFSMLFKIF